MKYIQPQINSCKFTCPSCGAITQQRWAQIHWDGKNYGSTYEHPIRIALCTHCEKASVWVEGKMFYPEIGNSPFPNPEMPEKVQKLYLEAASIYTKSPRGAAALLRLAIQVLLKELGEEGKNINLDITSLVSKGLPKIVQQSLDVVRVTGNNAVHPGQIDTDDINVVGNLFELINVIIEYMIALPNKVSGLYSVLPTSTKESINKRDKK